MRTCKTCHADILWAKTEKGKNMPLDARPIVVGFVLDQEDGGTIRAKSMPVYQSHYASCPQASQHRRKKG